MADLLWPDRTMGVFETLLVLDGAPIELDAHLERLQWSARDLFEAEPPAGTRELVIERAAAMSLGRMRLTVLPGEAGGLVADTVATEIDPGDVFPGWERAIALRPFVVPGGLGNHKWADRAGLAWTESGESAGWLPLVVDVGDEILEASRANVFAVEGETFVTPASDGRILPGVARSRAVSVARSLGIEVRQEALTAQRLIAAGEAFLTGSVRGIEPARSFGDAELGPPSEPVKRVAEEMRRIWTAEGAALRPRPASVGSA